MPIVPGVGPAWTAAEIREAARVLSEYDIEARVPGAVCVRNGVGNLAVLALDGDAEAGYAQAGWIDITTGRVHLFTADGTEIS
jgi:hypothetical protein